MPRILLVEDDANILANMSEILKINDYEVDQVANGQEALNFLKSTRSLPDVIVSDIMMPQMSGYELLEVCHLCAEWRGIPFIFLSALGDRKDILTGKKLGADDYLVKPFRTDELIVAIENKLRHIEQIKTSAETKLDQSRRELLTLISHELRTPLSAIYGGAELLADSLVTVPDSMANRMLTLVQSGAKRMRRLVDQIVLMMQLDSQNLALSLKDSSHHYNMQVIAERAYALLEEEWYPDHPQVTFDFHWPRNPVMVTGNLDFLVMMVGEGIRNAVTFSPIGGLVTVELMCDDQGALITVTDQGPGIPADDLPRVWDRFVQINRDKFEQQGMGLGLSLARESARLHRGDCILESRVGGGTRFVLRLPLWSMQTAN